MVQRSYVVDVAVSDVDAAARTFAEVLGIEPMQTDHYDPSGEMRQRHFPVGGLNAVGLQSVERPQAGSRNSVADRLATRGEGAYLIGFLVDDAAARQAELESIGVQFALRRPVTYEAGRMTITRPVHGTVIEFAQHNSPAETQKWQTLAAEATKRHVLRASHAYIAIDAFDEAVALFESALGAGATTPVADGSVLIPTEGLDGVIITSTSVGFPGMAEGCIEGEGICCLGFIVSDLAVIARHLEELGVESCSVQSSLPGLGPVVTTEPLHGVSLQFIQADRAARTG